MTVKVFGQLNDIVGGNLVSIDEIADTDELIKKLQSKYPILINTKYKISVNRNIIQSNTTLQHDAEIALLPPFSGG